MSINTDVPAVELRIAQTMGTANEVYFGYRNRQATGMTDDKIFLYFIGSKMSMATIRLGVPTSIVLDRISGSMVWSWADESGSPSLSVLMQIIAMQTWIALASAACYTICAVFWIRAAWAPKPQSDRKMFAVLDDKGHTPQSRVSARDNVIAALFTAAGAILSAAGELMNVWMK